MLNRHPVVLTALEEDLKSIGLLPEGEFKPAPSGEPTPTPEAPGRNAGAMSEKPSSKGKTGTVEAPPHQGATPPKANPPVVPGAKDEATIRGMLDKVRAGGSAGKSPPSPEAPETVQGGRSREEGAHGVAYEAVNRIRTRTVETTEPAPESGPLARVKALVDRVNDIMETIDSEHQAEAVKAFANASVIAEMLRQGFVEFSQKFNDTDLAEAAEAYGLMAEEAGEIAKAIEGNEDLDVEKVQEEFDKTIDALFAGLDLYADIVEADDDDEEEDDDEEKEKKEKEKADKEKEEATRFPTVLVKKGGKPNAPSTGAMSAPKSTPGMRLNMSRTEAYYPMGKGPKAKETKK